MSLRSYKCVVIGQEGVFQTLYKCNSVIKCPLGESKDYVNAFLLDVQWVNPRIT